MYAGETYGRYTRVNSTWRLIVRKIISIDNFGVLYEEVLEPEEGTCVDTDNFAVGVTLEEWMNWAGEAFLISE